MIFQVLGVIRDFLGILGIFLGILKLGCVFVGDVLRLVP